MASPNSKGPRVLSSGTRNLGGSDLSCNLLQLSNHRVKHRALLDANRQLYRHMQTGAIVEEAWWDPLAELVETTAYLADGSCPTQELQPNWRIAECSPPLVVKSEPCAGPAKQQIPAVSSWA